MPAFGSGAKLSITHQTSMGATSPSSWRSIPFASHDLSYDVADLVDDSIVGNPDEPDRVSGISGIGGGFQANIHPLALGYYLYGLCGAASVAAAGAAYKHTFRPSSGNFGDKNTVPPFAIQVNAGETGVSSSYLLQDCFFNTGELSITAGAYLRGTWGLIGKSGTLLTTAAPYDWPSAVKPLTWSACSVSIAGAAVQRYHDLKITLNNNLAAQDRIDGTTQHTFFFREGFRQNRFAGTVDLAQADWLKMKNETEGALVITCGGASAISSGYNEFLEISMPRFVFTKVPINISGTGVVTVAVEGRGMYLSTSLCSVQFTLQNTVASYP